MNNVQATVAAPELSPRRRRLTGLLLLLLAPGLAVAQHGLAGHDRLVHDDAQLLRPATVVRPERTLVRYADSSGVELAVVTVPSLHGREVAQVGDSIKNAWGVGDKATRRGILYLIAPREHRQAIRTGQGLEAFLPDGLCFRILWKTTPSMKQDLESAIVNRVGAIQQELALAVQKETDRLMPADTGAVAAAAARTAAQAREEANALDGAMRHLDAVQVVEEPLFSATTLLLWAGFALLAGVVMIGYLSSSAAAKKRRGQRPAPARKRLAGPQTGNQPNAARLPQAAGASSGSNGLGLLAAAVLLSSSDDKKKWDDTSSSWSGWGGSDDSSTSSDSDSFSFGGDAHTGGGGASAGW